MIKYLYLCKTNGSDMKPFIVWEEVISKQWISLNPENTAELIEFKEFLTPDLDVKALEVVLRNKIIASFGMENNVNTVVFKGQCQYNDNWYEHHPVLVLIDNQANEIQHNISLDDFAPYASYQQPDGTYKLMPDITFKY